MRKHIQSEISQSNILTTYMNAVCLFILGNASLKLSINSPKKGFVFFRWLKFTPQVLQFVIQIFNFPCQDFRRVCFGVNQVQYLSFLQEQLNLLKTNHYTSSNQKAENSNAPEKLSVSW